MGILFGLIGLLIMLALFAGLIVLIIFIARKAGLLKQADDTKGEGENALSVVKSYFYNVQWIQKSITWRFFLVAILIGLMTTPLIMV